MTNPLHELSIAEAGRALRAGAVTSVALTQDAISRINRIEPQINAFITRTDDRALAEAEAADRDFAAGIDKGPLQGVPYALKDIYETEGLRTTCHSKLLLNNVPKADGVVATKLKDNGGVLLGKLATHEFAIGGPSFDLPFPPARNPWNTDHVPGGSSSGSAAAVAAGICRMAMGSDTGGSIRGPASYCGTVGLKPTYGLVSRRGVFPLSYTLDHIGPLTWSVEDTAITMQIIAGHDRLDPASADVPVPDFTGRLGRGVQGLRIGLPRHFFAKAAGLSPEVLASIENAAEVLARAGAIVEEVTLPDYDLFNATGRVLMISEAYAIHEKDFQTRPLDYGKHTFQRILPGATLRASDLMQAQRLRRELTQVLNLQVLKRYDALLTACALAPAPAFAEISDDAPPIFPIQSLPFNVTGNPAMSMPSGFSKAGLPLAVQIVGRPFEDDLVLQIGETLEIELGLHAKRPALAA